MENGRWRRGFAHIAIGVLVLAVSLAATAACPPWRGAPVIIKSSGESLCGKHHELLRKTTVYGPDPAICILVQENKEAAKARACSPNAIPFGVSRTKSQLYSRAVETSYCPQCEAFVHTQAKNRMLSAVAVATALCRRNYVAHAIGAPYADRAASLQQKHRRL